jgi:hypothetical protein
MEGYTKISEGNRRAELIRKNRLGVNPSKLD